MSKNMDNIMSLRKEEKNNVLNDFTIFSALKENLHPMMTSCFVLPNLVRESLFPKIRLERCIASSE